MGNPDIVVCMGSRNSLILKKIISTSSQKAGAMGEFSAGKTRRAANFLMVEVEVVAWQECNNHDLLYGNLVGITASHKRHCWDRATISVNSKVSSINFCSGVRCIVNMTKSRVVCWTFIGPVQACIFPTLCCCWIGNSTKNCLPFCRLNQFNPAFK